MKALLKHINSKLHNIHVIWVMMITLTLFTYALGKLSYNGLFIVVVLLLTAAIKGTFIIRDYMELGGVSLVWKVIMYGWLGTVISALAITYMISL